MILIGILHFFKMCPSKQSAKADQSVHGEFSRLSAQRTEACVVLNVSFDTTLRVTQSTVGKARFVRNNKKAATQGCCFHQSGAGGVRTLVQTMGTQAFYMLIS